MKPGMAPQGLYLAIHPSLRPAPPPPDTEEEVDWNFVFNPPSPPSPPLPSTTPPHQPPQPQPQPEPEPANMAEFKDKEEVSRELDINFYGSKKDGEQKVDVKAEGVRVGSTPVRVPSRNEAQLHLSGVKPDDSNLQESLDFTDQLLEEQYRGQANSFTRSRSSSSIAASPSIRSVSSPLPSPIANSPLVNSPRLPRLKSNSNFRTPTRKGESFAAVQRKLSLGTPTHRGLGLNIIPESPHVPQSPRILLESPSAGRRVVSSPAPLNLRPFRLRSGTQSGLSPQEGCSSSPFFPHYGYKIPGVSSPLSKKKSTRDPVYYFTLEERKFIAEAVAAKEDLCEHHEKCTDCLNKEFAYLENKIMPTSIPPEDRQKIINNNRSLRNIKNELENLLENNVLTDAMYDQIMSSLPSESPLNGPAPTPRSAAQNPSPAPSDQMARMTIANPPPAYTNTPPPPPPRNQTPQPPSRPEIARATALYRYSEPDDCTFEVGDQISVFEYMNPEWWMGRNMRTGKEGVFPMNYVQIQAPQNQNGFYGNEKQNVGGYPGQPQYAQQGPPAPGPSNPYNAAVPPMAIAEGGQTDANKPSKGGEMGKKFGKKLGNAAIFGAGATIGGNIVNSIF